MTLTNVQWPEGDRLWAHQSFGSGTLCVNCMKRIEDFQYVGAVFIDGDGVVAHYRCDEPNWHPLGRIERSDGKITLCPDVTSPT